MLTLRGSRALSQFRLQKLLADLTADLTSDELGILDQLLTYGPKSAGAPEVDGILQVVAPRPGTISPWSSKATDIARICGLAKVRRIERVIAYTFDAGAPG